MHYVEYGKIELCFSYKLCGIFVLDMIRVEYKHKEIFHCDTL